MAFELKKYLPPSFHASPAVSATKEVFWTPTSYSSRMGRGAVGDTWESAVREGAKKNAVVFICLDRLAKAYAEAPLRFYHGEEVIDGHPLSHTLDRPNEDMGQAELLLYTMVYAAIGGNGYWHKLRSLDGRLQGFMPYSAGEMWPVSARGKRIAYYRHASGITIPKTDVIHFKWPVIDPEDPKLGLSPLRVLGREVGQDNEATRFVIALLKNDTVIRTVATPGADSVAITPEKRAELEDTFAQQFGGDRRGGLFVAEPGMTIERLGLSLDELAFDALRAVPEARISAAYGVPAIVAGLTVGLNRSTYANFAEARVQMTQDTIAPIWRLWSNEIETEMRRESGDEGLGVRHDTSKVQALQEDVSRKQARALAAYDKGLATLNEARAQMGLPPVDGGDVFKSQPGLTAPGAAQQAATGGTTTNNDLPSQTGDTTATANDQGQSADG